MITSLLIFEDNHQLRQSLQLLLNDGISFAVRGAFGDCQDAGTHTRTLQPDLVIMDIDMPGMTGIEGIRLVKAAKPDTKIIMYTVLEDDDHLFQCLCAGADGYLLKHTPPARLVMALQDAMEGGSPMSPQIAARVLRYFRQQGRPAQDYGLTDREKEILQLLIDGKGYKMIAAECFVSLDTVKKHLKNIYLKLQVSCGTEAVAKALRERIVSM